VLLGEPSGNLCTVDLDREEAITPFLGKNPRLRETLSSTGSGVGAQFWLRIRGYYIPKVLKISVTERLAAKYGGVPRNPDTGTYDVGEWRGGAKVHDLGATRVGARLRDPNPGEAGRSDDGRNFAPERMELAADPA